MNNTIEKNEVKNAGPYASAPLKVGDQVGVRYHSDIKPGTVIKATVSRATIRLHEFKLLNGPESGAPDALVVTVGGFCAHWEGRQRNEIDWASDAGTVTVTFRKGDRLNGQTGLWRQTGYTGGRGQLGGVIYNEAIAFHDYNF